LRVAIVGPVFPFRAGIAYCTTRLAQELKADVVSFRRQFPRRFYPGGDDIDPTLPRAEAAFILDILNPLTWLRAGWRLRKYDAVIFVWWVWVWAIPYRLMMALLPRHTRIVLQCHNIGDKEPAWWKRVLTNIVLRRAKELVVHAQSEAREAWKRSRGRHTITTFLPVHELGGPIPSRDDAREMLDVTAKNVALFFGHVRPFKALDIVFRAWRELKTDVQLLVAGEAWFGSGDEYRNLARDLGLDVIPSSVRARPSPGLRPPSPGGRGVSTQDESARHRLIESLLPPGEGARTADEGRVNGSAADDAGPSGAPAPPPARTTEGDARSVRFDFRFIPDAEIATWFAAADVVLAPYRIEAQSGVALTAFHFARPVIASTVGGLPEIVVEGQNGMLIPADDAPALARAVDAFFARDDRAAMEQHAAEAARKYSWAEYANVFKRLLTGP
jgi:glycosyltransferase involved in cell wall biosynthesis